MAGVDKLYGTKDQFDELAAWTEKHDLDDIRRRMQDRDDWEDSNYQCIALFSFEHDILLYDYCPLTWVTDRIKEQYNGHPAEDLTRSPNHD